MRNIDLKVKIGKLELATPIICASGTFGFGEELRGLVNYKDIGAITTKTITLKPRAGNPPPRIFETECGVINSVGLENPGVEAFLKQNHPSKSEKVIVSIGGQSAAEYKELIRRIEPINNIEAIELNLSCPNIKGKRIVSQNRRLSYNLVNSLRKLTKKVLIAKISPEVTAIDDIAKSVEAAGADGVSLVNTFFAMAINIESRRPYLGNGYGGYSGKAIKPLSVYRVYKVFKSVKIPIIGGGGIEAADDAIEFILAGASAVSLGTINLVYPDAAGRILSGIKDYLRRNKLSCINDMKINDKK